MKKMEKLPMCRICLAENVRMYVVVNMNLHNLYEKLTDIPFVTEDRRPILACYFCCTKLKQCYQLLRQCLKAEELFTQRMNGDYETNPLINQNHLEFFSGFIKSPIMHISIDGECQTESIAMKEELPAVCEGQDDIIEPKEELQSGELEPDLDNSCVDVADIPPHHSESDSGDDVPLMTFKTEVEEEQEVSQKKRTASETTSTPRHRQPRPTRPRASGRPRFVHQSNTAALDEVRATIARIEEMRTRTEELVATASLNTSNAMTGIASSMTSISNAMTTMAESLRTFIAHRVNVLKLNILLAQ